MSIPAGQKTFSGLEKVISQPDRRQGLRGWTQQRWAADQTLVRPQPRVRGPQL